MKFILGLTNWYENWELSSRAAVEADRLGFWGLSMPDHYVRARSTKAGTVESWIALALLASKTKTIHVGTMVTPIPFRPPAMLAKMVSTVDVISNGRTFLGVGAGWFDKEFEAYSEWNKPSVRVSKTEEGLRLMIDLWTKERVDFHGEYYRVNAGTLEPKPVQKPHPPLLFGGFSARMLRLAGKYGDIVFFAPDMKLGVEEAKDIVLEAARESGRKTILSFAAGLPADEDKSGSKYDSKRFWNAISKAESDGCEYFDFSVPEDKLLDSMIDFAKTVMPSFT